MLSRLLTTIFYTLVAVSCLAEDSIYFSEESWDKQLRLVIARGPVILDKALQLDIDPPPKNSSTHTRYELETLRAYKLERSQYIKQLIVKENKNHAVEEWFTNMLVLDYATTPQTVNLLHLVATEVAYFVLREKWHYQRARPSQLADDLDPVIPNPPHSSYPSGHAAQTYALALTLGELKQADKNAYIHRAFNIARRREIAGVHFPSDSLAGFSLAEFVFSKLKNTQEFQALVQQARKELSNDQ